MDEHVLSSFFEELEKISSEESFPLPKTRADKWKAFKGGVKGEVGPAIGATLGAGLAQAYGISPVVGAAGGYGVGAIPEIIRGIARRGH